jgi:iron complex outermembrane receptor protein
MNKKMLAQARRSLRRLSSRKFRNLNLIVPTVCALLFAAAEKPTFAYADGAAAASTSTGLEEIIVTARRREENIQSLPAAVTALTTEDLQQQVVTRSDDLPNLVPTLRVTYGAGGGRDSPDFALRGLRSTGVVLYFADIPISGPAIERSFFDLSSVQVLTGPQGTLFGKNTTAGAILFGPAPPTSNFEGAVQIDGGDYNLYGGQVMLNLPITDQLMLRVAGEFGQRNGFTTVATTTRNFSTGNRYNSFDNDNHNNQRISLLYKPADSISNLLIYDRFDSNQAPTFYKTVATQPCPPGAPPGSFIAACVYRPPFTTVNNLPTWDSEFAISQALGPRKTALNYQGRDTTNSWGISNTTSVELNQYFTIKNLVGYRELNTERYGAITDLNDLSSVVDNIANIHQATEEGQLQVLAFDNRLHWFTGAFYSHIASYNPSEYLLSPPNPFINPYVAIGTNRTNSSAAYTQATFEALPGLNLTGGYRYTQDRVGAINSNTYNGKCAFLPPFSQPSIFVNAANCTRTQYAVFTAPSWTLSADYKIADHILAYVTSRRGYNTGGFNALANIQSLATYAPETVTDIEVGLKSDWMLAGMPFRANVAIYRSKYKDIQRSVDRVVSGRPSVYVVNAAQATIRGIDVDLEAKLFEASGKGSLDASFHADYLDAKYDSFLYQNPDGSYADIKDNALADAPAITGVVALQYHFPVPQPFANDLSFRVSWNYTSRQYFTDVNQGNALISNKADPYDQQAAYGLVDAQLLWHGVLGTKVDATVWGKNLTNRLYYTGTTNTIGQLGWVDATYGEPLTYGLRLRYQF